MHVNVRVRCWLTRLPAFACIHTHTHMCVSLYSLDTQYQFSNPSRVESANSEETIHLPQETHQHMHHMHILHTSKQIDAHLGLYSFNATSEHVYFNEQENHHAHTHTGTCSCIGNHRVVHRERGIHRCGCFYWCSVSSNNMHDKQHQQKITIMDVWKCGTSKCFHCTSSSSSPSPSSSSFASFSYSLPFSS